MRLYRKLWIFVAVFSTLLLGGCGLSLAGDVTPPPNYVPPTEAAGANQSGTQPASQRTVFPLVPPDPAAGAAIFAQKCAPCHGTGGMGDGPQASKLPNTPAAIGSADFARKSRPVDWFNVVTTGNLDKFMPGFTESLSDRQRWDVVAYVYTLSAPKEITDQGKVLYDQSCAECHGTTGLADGPKVTNLNTKPIAWARDESRLALLSSDEMVKVIADGKGEMPGYADKLAESQRYAVAAYVRSLGFTSSGNTPENASANSTPVSASADTTPQPGQTAVASGQATTVPEKINISGTVANGSQGGKLPGGLKADLVAFSGMNQAFDQSTEVAQDGAYSFKDVKFDPNFVYMVKVTSNGTTFNSDILHGTDVANGQASLPVQIYDTTTDTSSLRTERLHIFFDFTKPGQVQVVNLWLISNSSDKMVVPDGKKPVIQFEIPQGATNLQFQDGQLGDGHYIQTDKGFGDLLSVAPGQGQQNQQNQVLFAYDLPYENQLTFGVKAPLPVDATVVMVPPTGVKLKSSLLTDAGQQDVQGMAFQMYQAVSAIKAGDSLDMTLTGKSGSGGTTTPQNSTMYLLIGLGAFGLVLVGAGVWLFLSRRRTALQTSAVGAGGSALELENSESSESLLDAIVALDDLHASGALPDAAYQERRTDLKSRLADALQREKGK